jgi:hypothetical protein
VITNAADAVRSAVAALNAGDLDGYLAYFDASCPRWVAGFDQPLSLADIRDSFQQLHAAFAGLHLDEDLLFGDERYACARWRLRGVHVREYLGFAPARQSIDVETCEIYEVDRDLVISSWVYGDVLGQLSRQLSTEDGDIT